MGALNLFGTLNLMGTLTLAADGGKVTVDGAPVLLEFEDVSHAHDTDAAPVILPPPPAGPMDPGTAVKIFKSFNSTVKVKVKGKDKNIVAMGVHLQGDTPTWPGMVLPGSTKVTINRIPINVQGDKGITLPNGGSVEYSSSGQE